MEKRIIECVPNFSEGRDMSVISQITGAVEEVEGAILLNVDPGRDTNRTVVTFAGEPDAVIEAAFMAVRKAAELIDMSKHQGEHPRMGATDVCPLIPVSGITMEETVIYARRLAERIGNELQIPVYCYEFAAFEEKRKNLSDIRAGEYEGLAKKLGDPAWMPDFGPALFNARSGATVVGARDFLVAFNVNLNTTSVRRANAVAYDIREKGRPLREGDKLTGKILQNENGEPLMQPGSLRSVKAIGWYMDEYGIAQISMNLTDLSVTPVHIAFDEVCRKADARGIRVTGSELVGLIPLRSILEAGRWFLEKQQRSAGVPDDELIKIAVKSLGLSDLRKFDPDEKIIENVLEKRRKERDGSHKKLISMSLSGFMNEVASESPAPGGGSVSSYAGAMGVALGTMVANLSSHKRGWDDRWREFSDVAVRGKELQNRLLSLVDEDTNAYNRIIEARKKPAKTEREKIVRDEAIEEATKYAIIIPFRVMETAVASFNILSEMVEKGNPGSVTDAAVGALMVRACIRGAFLNMKINAKDLKDTQFGQEMIKKGSEIELVASQEEKKILQLVEPAVNQDSSKH